jgi:hypothetical protein
MQSRGMLGCFRCTGVFWIGWYFYGDISYFWQQYFCYEMCNKLYLLFFDSFCWTNAHMVKIYWRIFLNNLNVVKHDQIYVFRMLAFNLLFQYLKKFRCFWISKHEFKITCKCMYSEYKHILVTYFITKITVKVNSGRQQNVRYIMYIM